LKLENPPYDFDAAFERAITGGSQAVLVLSSALFIAHRAHIAEIAITRRLPTMFVQRAYVEGGGLMSYGVNFAQMYRRGADYVVRILKGAKPADLPVEQASKFELVVNLKTAKSIGIEADGYPASRRRGDRVAFRAMSLRGLLHCISPLLAHRRREPMCRHVRSRRKLIYARWIAIRVLTQTGQSVGFHVIGIEDVRWPISLPAYRSTGVRFPRAVLKRGRAEFSRR
jgi:hypothetical protein